MIWTGFRKKLQFQFEGLAEEFPCLHLQTCRELDFDPVLSIQNRAA